MSTEQNRERDEEDVIEPVMQTDRCAGQLCVTCKLPRVEEEAIRIDREKNTIVIAASGDGKTYRKTVTIPAVMRMVGRKFKNGELEILFETPDHP